MTDLALRPDAPEVADAAATLRSAYVHIPFCRRRCPYCDFAVVAPEDGPTPLPMSEYLAAVRSEIDMEPPWAELDAVAFGGGTPSAVPAGDLAAILDRLRSRFGLSEDAEVSLEANPEDWSRESGMALVEAGFTRISFGVQSLDAEVLRELGRAHSPDQARRAVAEAKLLGFGTVNVDLIFGSPAESDASWRESVAQTLSLGPDHVSGYALTVERGTALSRAVAAGAPGPDPDIQADRYERLVAACRRAGLVRYEVSNFARPGHVCRYTSSTWAQGEFIAFGLGAHDHRGGVRHRNVRRLDAYLERVAAGDRPRAGAERLDAWGRDQERLFLGLRRAAGVRAGPAGRALLASASGRRLIDAGVLAVRDDRLVVSDPLLTDEVVRSVFAIEAPLPVPAVARS